MRILEEICFGNYLLISSLLTNAEAWYNLTNAEVSELEKVDEDMFRKVLECPISTPKEFLYLELGVSPIRNIIRSRRLNFLHYILHEDDQSLIYQFLEAQRLNPVKNDWCQTVVEDLEFFEIDLSMGEIESMPQATFSALVKKNERIATLKYLNDQKVTKNHTKILHIDHSELSMQDYLKPNGASIEESKFTFLVRSRMLDIRTNYRGQYLDTDTLCPVCLKEEDTQQHLLVCDQLCESETIVKQVPEYSDLFGENLDKKLLISRVLRKHFQARKKVLKLKENLKSTQQCGPSDPVGSAVFNYMY